MKERYYSKAMKHRNRNTHKKEQKAEKIQLIKYQKDDFSIQNNTLVGTLL